MNLSNLTAPTIFKGPMKAGVTHTHYHPSVPRNSTESRHNVVPLTGTKTAQERRRTLKLMKTLPQGVRIGRWSDDRPSPFFVRYGKPRKVESFATEAERNDKAETLAATKEEFGASRINYDPAEWAAFQEWKAKHSRPALIAKEAVSRYMAFRLNEDVKEDSDTHIHMRTRLEYRFLGRFGPLPLKDITTDMVREWLNTLPNPRKPGELMGQVTLRHYRKEVNVFFTRAVEEGWLDRNPCLAVKSPKVTEKKRKPMLVRDVFELMKANRNQPVAGRMALEFWGGLRCSAVEDLTKADLDFEKRSIFIRRQKVGDEKTRQGHPGPLWDWLNHAPEGCWTMAPSYYDTAKALAFARAQMKNPGNAMRHSCASYLLALWKNYQTVGYLLQHTRSTTTQQYEGAATEEDARLYYAITPTAVLMTWEEFLAANTQPKTK